MTMKTLQMLVVCACLYGCTASESSSLHLAQSAVAAQLKDPDSAKFLNGFVVESLDTSAKYTQLKYACGEVNAKNLFGVYAGAVRYVVLIGVPNGGTTQEALTVDLEKLPRDEVFAMSFWNVSCSQRS